MGGAGFSDGVYDLVGFKVTVKDGRATLDNGTLAGSVATLDQCVRNLTRLVGLPLHNAVQMASLNPVRAIGMSDKMGSVEAGKEANLIVIDNDVNVYLTMVNGQIVYNQIG
jgi:N-acetylglucosamine-6-phosphate deacetylase